jgi:hypothetical protein
MKWLIMLSLIVLTSTGCKNRKAGDALNQREAALNQREKELALRETVLQLKETALLEKQNRLDSTLKLDTTRLVYLPVIGLWSAKMVCTETTCQGSAVGDNKTEQWDLSYQSNSLIAKAMVNNKISRVYTGSYTGNAFELTEEQSDSAAGVVTKMIVRLNLVDSTHLQGQRQIIREGDCRIVYDLKLERNS